MIASREARRLGALPKNCHLLPSTAILEPQDRYDLFNRCIPFPSEGMLAKLSLVLRLPRWGLAGCRQLDPSHSSPATCECANAEPCQNKILGKTPCPLINNLRSESILLPRSYSSP